MHSRKLKPAQVVKVGIPLGGFLKLGAPFRGAAIIGVIEFWGIYKGIPLSGHAHLLQEAFQNLQLQEDSARRLYKSVLAAMLRSVIAEKHTHAVILAGVRDR